MKLSDQGGKLVVPPSMQEDPLYQTALLAAQDDALNADMAAWDALAGDGIK